MRWLSAVFMLACAAVAGADSGHPSVGRQKPRDGEIIRAVIRVLQEKGVPGNEIFAVIQAVRRERDEGPRIPHDHRPDRLVGK